MNSLLARERHATVHVVNDALRQAQQAIQNERVRAALLERASASATHAAALLRDYEASQLHAETLKAKITEHEATIDELRRVLTDSTKTKTKLTWQLGASEGHNDQLSHSLEEEHTRVTATAKELKVAKEEQDNIKRSSFRHLDKQHEREMAQMRKRQDADIRRFAAVLIQRVARRHRAEAEKMTAQAREQLSDVQKLAGLQIEAAREAVAVDGMNSKFRGQHMTVIDGACVERTVREYLIKLVNTPEAKLQRQENTEAAKFARELITGRPEAVCICPQSSCQRLTCHSIARAHAILCA